MRKSNLLKRGLFLIISSIIMVNTQAQIGLNFQGVARTSNNVILASQAITIKLSILQGSATGTADYIETRKVTTNAQGLFTAVIGDTGAISTLGNFTTINWKLTPKFLKIEMDPAAGSNFVTMGTTQFQYVAYAQFANSVDAENITGVVPVARGGTGANSLSLFKTTLALNNVNNTTDLSKPISTATQTALDLKLNAADTVKYVKQTYTDSALLTKLNLKDTVKYVKQTYADSALLTKLSITGNAATATSATTAISAGTAATATKLATARKINGVDFDGSGDITVTSSADAGTLTGTTLKSTVTNSSLTSVGTLTNLTVTNPITGSVTGNAATATKLATARKINGVDFDGSGDITVTSSADAGTLTGTTLNATVTGSSLTSVGILMNLTVTNPIDGSLKGNAETATLATNAGTATKLATARTINGVSFDGSENINITALSDAGTLTGTTLNATVTGSSLTSVGTLANLTVTNPIVGSITGNAATATSATTATLAGTATSATKLATARTINGVAFDGSGDITVEADAGTLTGTTLKSTVTGSSLTSVGTLANLTVTNAIAGSITGNAATATTATTATSAGTASTATKLATSRNINGVAFDGSGDITVTADAGTLTGTTLKSTITGSSLTSVGTLANLTVTNAIAGSITGNAATATTATTATSAGTASTATKLATSRNINGVAFDGSGDITVTADAGTLTGTTLKSTITGSSLTSVGTIASLTTGAITNSGKVIVGASSAASASAILEASSTTQGFLPPRMNYYQRTQITSPVAGLTIWCSNCGVSGEMQVFNGGAWTNMSGGTATGTISLSIGDSYQGGIVAYILVSGDPGYDANTQHGLIAATSDQSAGIRWYNGTYTITGATGTAIGTGLANTNTIITSQGGTATSYAAGLARAYAGGGYKDWYLPSKDELAKLYAMKQLGFGGFTGGDYWSSTEHANLNLNIAWNQRFLNGNQNYPFKDDTYYVRAIRAF